MRNIRPWLGPILRSVGDRAIRAEKLKIKSGLVVEIRKAMRSLRLTQQEAAKRMGIPQPKVSGMMRGDFTNLSERKLMDCLNRLGYDIEIKVTPASQPVGQLTLAVSQETAFFNRSSSRDATIL